MKLYRLCSRRYVATAFTGLGASLAGGRWNQRRAPVVYTAASLSLAALECLVHFSAQTLPDDYVSITVTTPAKAKVETIELTVLPPDWAAEDPPLTTRQIGMDWFNRQASLLLKVPSAIIPTEFNYVINPQHHEFNQLLIEQPALFRFDPRLKQ